MTRLPLLFAVFALIGLTAISGCTYPSASENSVEFSGDIERIDGQFRMAGTVFVDGTNRRDVTDVAVVLYDENQTVIDRMPVGSISSHSEGPYPTRQPVNITTDRLPTYVIIESPDIWTPNIWGNSVPSRASRWTRYGYYQDYWVASEDERFPSA
ncbi:hypothetical protein ACFQH3_13770 [Haladaptatus sp. GCM10025707]|uniref:hypothetical protein n=1 Tax=unclassified Haladaptatus TaxID=2622732 RepID=UPI0023E89387|nr:hypothetical protein [Haladaptatus sp. QDMS2]